MPFSTECGHEYKLGEKFCAVCGQAIPGATLTQYTTPAPPTQTQYLSSPNSSQPDLSKYEKAERALCIHCGYEGIFGVNRTHDESALSASIGYWFLATIGTFIFIMIIGDPNNLRNYLTPIIILPISIAISVYKYRKIESFHCPSCSRYFYKNKAGKFAKTKNLKDF